jgi:hypothetical protein
LTFLSFLPEVISNPHFTTVMVDLLTIVHTLHL